MTETPRFDGAVLIRALAVTVGVVVTTTGVVGSAHAQRGGQAGASMKPDIIVVMVDDLAYIGDDRLLERLPNIRRLFLRDGKRFKKAYNEVPLCCPARANFHSGQHTLRNGVTANHPHAFDHSKTLAVAMDAAGYHTAFIGKYMNNYDGTDVLPGWDRLFMTDRNHPRRPTYWDRTGMHRTVKGRFFDDVIRAKAVHQMKDAPTDTPVFQFISPYAPHRHRGRCGASGSPTCKLTPAVMKRDRGARECRGIGRYRPPNYTISRARDPFPGPAPTAWRRGWPLVRFCESMLVVDRTVRRVRNAQRERGRPAYWFFLSDNGMAWGQHGFPMKMGPWATRLPFYVSGPGISGKATRARVSIIDIPVTIASIAGAHMPWADGRSFLPVLEGAKASHRTEILKHMPPKPPNSPLVYRAWQGIRSGKWRYIRWHSGKQELYDLSKDPWQRRNARKERPNVVARLDARLDELLSESRGP